MNIEIETIEELSKDRYRLKALYYFSLMSDIEGIDIALKRHSLKNLLKIEDLGFCYIENEEGEFESVSLYLPILTTDGINRLYVYGAFTDPLYRGKGNYLAMEERLIEKFNPDEYCIQTKSNRFYESLSKRGFKVKGIDSDLNESDVEIQLIKVLR